MTGQWALGEVRYWSGDPRGFRDGSGDPRGGLAQVGGPSLRFGTGRESHGEVLDRSADTRGPTGRSWMGRRTIGGPAERSRTGRWTLGGGPRWVERPSGRSKTSRGTFVNFESRETSQGNLGQVREGSGDPPGCLGQVGRPSGRSETGQGTFEEVRDGPGDPLGGPGQVGEPSGRSGTGRENLGEVRDGSVDPWEVQDRSGDPRGFLDGSGNPR